MALRSTHKTNIEMITAIAQMVNQGPAEVKVLVEQRYKTRSLISLHHSLGATIRNEFHLWDPNHPVYQVWVRSDKDPDSSFHPDAYSMDLLNDACLLMFGEIPELVEA